ncbi:MAG: DUF3551 domain-containing protein [Xanthobacteraceae bacterium]|jgi:hypothetical protein|nr:DUF3551 domain-containing protein [Xanthobacteraceae bacterium]
MKMLMMTGAVVAGLVALQAQATAQQEAVRANERYCLDAVGFEGGTQPLLCRFTTIEQCNMSKTGPTDRCMLNPRLGDRR